MTFTFRSRLSKKDFVRANMYLTWTAKRILSYLLVSLLLVVIGFSIRDPNSKGGDGFFFCISLAIMIPIVRPLRFLYVVRKKYDQHFASDMELTFTVDPDKICIASGDGSSSTVPWSTTSKFRELKGCLLVYTDAGSIILGTADLDEEQKMYIRSRVTLQPMNLCP